MFDKTIGWPQEAKFSLNDSRMSKGLHTSAGGIAFDYRQGTQVLE